MDEFAGGGHPPSGTPAEATATVTIPARFCGPSGSANGGYTAGTVARALAAGPGTSVEVRLWIKPPIDTPLHVVRIEDGSVELHSPGGDLVATGRVVDNVPLDPPHPARPSEALASSVPFDVAVHPFPSCFVCGPSRAAGDGLRIFAGEVPGRGVFAARWVPDASVSDASGVVAGEVVWAALDCPGGQAISVIAGGEQAVLLGTIVGTHNGRVRAGEEYVLTSWHIASEGRKHTSGTLLTTADGTEMGRSRAIWIAVPRT